MAIAYAILNQVGAGTIALVDRNAEKLEGEANDLAQGSAFHQNVRIEASDSYVSIHVSTLNQSCTKIQCRFSLSLFLDPFSKYKQSTPKPKTNRHDKILNYFDRLFQPTPIWSLSRRVRHKNQANHV
jgi:hypothetical protein